MSRNTTNGMARHLLAANEGQLRLLAPVLMDAVARELGLPQPSPDHKWPADIVEATREFLTCVAMDDLGRIREADSVFEQVGSESARGGVDFDMLAAGIRLAARRTQAQVHRAVIAEDLTDDTEAVLELLGRVVAAGEVVVSAARRGYEIAELADADEDGVARRLAGRLIRGGSPVTGLAAELGWADDVMVCAILVSAEGAASIRRRAHHRLAHYSREHDVVLVHPVDEGRLATTLRPLLAQHSCAVGPAVPLADFRDSMDLATRMRALTRPADATFADDVLLELACTADPAVSTALHRKHLAGLDGLPVEHRSVLLATLREWLLQWGHRPGIAEALGVHPQTVSGRVNRLKDLLADDLEDPAVRSELLVLLIAESAAELLTETGATRERAAIP